MNVNAMMSILRAEEVKTWFDLGLFIDRFRENRSVPSAHFLGSYDDFARTVSTGGVGFVSFFYSVDGASMEAQKYAKALKEVLGEIDLHYIAGEFHEQGELFLLPDAKRFQLDELASFDNWPLYHDFFHEKLERGGEVYNELILKFWREVLVISEKLGRYIEVNGIRLLYLINTNSNPGNVSLALALAFISEYLGIPVICNNHDFYWEGGHNEVKIQKGAKPGPRDHFFTNYHLGEVFSILELIYPWESRSWLSVNINESQSVALIDEHGHNPASVEQIETAMEIEKLQMGRDTRRQQETFRQLAAVLGGDEQGIPVTSIASALEWQLDSPAAIRPVLLGAENSSLSGFDRDNLVLIQPTRIIKRKSIEVSFTLVKKLFDDEDFVEYFEQNAALKVTILVTGPIATGHLKYFERVLEEFDRFILTMNPGYKKRVFLGFLFSEYDRPSFRAKHEAPISFREVFGIASLILLPSETEGRGLPIIEAAASGLPVFCRRYEPHAVYAHVIGEHLPKSDRLQVIDFTDPKLSDDVIEQVKHQLFSPKAFENANQHNRAVVEMRYSFAALVLAFSRLLHKLYMQMTSEPDAARLAKWSLDKYAAHIRANSEVVRDLLKTENRQYLPGYGQMAFMLFLKSLIDPSYFRVEEKRIRGTAMQYAKALVDGTPDPSPTDVEMVHQFYNAVDSVFRHRDGEIETRIDHSLAYRHRNKVHYPYRDLTPQELTGVVNFLYNRIASPPPVLKIAAVENISENWSDNISAMNDNAALAIDHLEELESRLEANIPIALFPGRHIELELESFVLYPVRKRLKLAPDERIHPRFFDRVDLAPIYIIQHGQSLGSSVTADVLRSHVYYRGSSELKLLFEYGICRIVASQQHCVGIHFREVGPAVAKALKRVRDDGGVLISSGDNAAMMTDIVDLDRFHIGKVTHAVAERIMGIPQGSAYVQWVPPGLRFTLAYPTPVQTAKDLSAALKSFRFKRLCDAMGENRVLQVLKTDAEQKGTPVRAVLRKLEHSEQKESDVEHTSLNGIYSDGLPWAGVLARLNVRGPEKKWRFAVLAATDRPKTVLQFVEEFGQENGELAKVAWNGGYILNPELVGKLGIPETFIGSPLGFIVSEGKLLSPPLFNKPAFIVKPDGGLQVRRVNCSQGITIADSGGTLSFGPDSYNLDLPNEKPCFYDLLYKNDSVLGDGRVVVRLAGNKIKELVTTSSSEKVPVLPVGLTLSLQPGDLPKSWTPGLELDIKMSGWDEIESAVEAGPQLLMDGEVCIDMPCEGWKTRNSIRTQAARLDFTDMRGPKIAIGIDRQGQLSILAVNGRIRESVGATHYDMAEILKSLGMVRAMGFDPGGSSTLVVDNKTLNISPYNAEYEQDIYSLPPEPRAVANAIVVW